MKKINWRVLIASLLIIYAVAGIGSFFTSNSVDSDWYEKTKPDLTPPNWVFPVVWNILFFLIAVSLYLSWTSSNKKEKKILALAFGINLVLNILWSVLYFGLRNPALAFYELILLGVSIIFMIFVTYRINKTSSYLLVPYFLWVSFAGVLNYLSAF